MLEFIYSLSEYAPFVIFVASVFDIFFATGLVLYGAAMLGSIAMMYTSGMITLELIIISAYMGTLLGNILNFFSGYYFAENKHVASKLQHPKIQTARKFLQSRGLFLFMLVCRFVAVSRPLYALLIGSLHIKFRRFIFYELIIAFFWVIFWLFILMQGENLYTYLFG